MQKKVLLLLDRLDQAYGKARYIARFDPMDELVSCILSQSTTDANSFPAFTRLRTEYPTWAEVREAGWEKVARVVHSAGLANGKAKSIVGCLEEIHARNGDYTLEPLRTLPTREARDWLITLPGVGLKTASIVLCFAFGRSSIPVDTHVHRLSLRLGIIPDKTSLEKAHELLLDRVPEEAAFRYHTSLIQHGRMTCIAPIPLCEACVVQDLCPWFKKVGPVRHAKALKRARQKK